MPDLLPCPFCGEIPTRFEADEMVGGKWGAVVCCIRGPEVRTHYGPVEDWRDDAIAAWNQRAGWRDIASAPKDDKKVFLLTHNGEPAIGHWEEDIGRYVSAASTRHTKWMPIPESEPPKEGGAK